MWPCIATSLKSTPYSCLRCAASGRRGIQELKVGISEFGQKRRPGRGRVDRIAWMVRARVGSPTRADLGTGKRLFLWPHEYRVFAAFPKQNAAVLLKVANKVVTLHAAGSSIFSRMTSCPWIVSSARVRLASRTSSTAFARFARASSSVAPCVLAPGSSSTKPA